MATTITLDSGNNSFFIFEGFLGGASAATAVNIKGDTIDGLGGKDTVDATKQGYAFPDSNFKLTVDGTGVITMTTSSGTATFRNFEQIKYTNLVVAVGSAGDDALTGTAAADVVLGVGGNDTLDGSAGADSMYGGAGNDTYVVDNAADQVIESNSSVHFATATRTATTVDAGGIDLVRAAISYVLGSVSFVENLELTGTAALNGTGNGLNNLITGNTAINSLSGGDGNDTLDGGAGADAMSGGIGNDVYRIDDVNDTVTEAAAEGTDRVESVLSYALGQNLENLTLTGTAAINGTGNDLANVIVGNSGANLLAGGGGADALTGDAGNDTLDGGAGADAMSGGIGNDAYKIDDINDTVTEAAAEGTDRVESVVSYALGQNLENLSLTGSAAINGGGNTLNNVITGNAAANTLSGGDGNDQLVGGLGADTLDGGIGNDILNGGAGNDVMRGGAGNDSYTVNANSTLDQVDEATTPGSGIDAGGVDTINSSISYLLTSVSFVENLTLTGTANIAGTGTNTANTITGNAGNNALAGAGGNDVLKGGLGNDVLTGGAGVDSFVFNTALNPATNLDTIKDWGAGGSTDKILLDDDIFLALGQVLATTALDSTMFVVGTAAQDANDHIIYNQGTGALFYDADGLGGADQVQFATLGVSSHPALTAASFFVVI